MRCHREWKGFSFRRWKMKIEIVFCSLLMLLFLLNATVKSGKKGFLVAFSLGWGASCGMRVSFLIKPRNSKSDWPSLPMWNPESNYFKDIWKWCKWKFLKKEESYFYIRLQWMSILITSFIQLYIMKIYAKLHLTLIRWE